jgi:TniQ
VAVLPVAPPPLPGELLASWIGRLACLYGVPPHCLWNELAGLPPAGFGWGDHSSGAGVPFLEQVGRVASAARLGGRALFATTMSAMLPDAPAAWLRSTTVSASWVPWCPACLREDLARHRVPHLRRLWAAGCVVVCPSHRVPLVDICPCCQRPAHPVFCWVPHWPMLACTACGALLSVGDGVPDATRASAEVLAGAARSAAVIGAGWLQARLLRALRGHPITRPCAGDLTPSRFVAAVEGLVGHLLSPLGIVRGARSDTAGRIGAGPPPRCSPVGLEAREAFAVMTAAAALLALPETELNTQSEWHYQRGEPIGLERLWTSPGGGGAVLRCPPEQLLDAVGSIGVAVALAVLGDPVIATYMAGRRRAAPLPRARFRTHRPRPQQEDRFSRLARRILADPESASRVRAAPTPAARSRLLGRLARAVLDAEHRPLLRPSPARRSLGPAVL